MKLITVIVWLHGNFWACSLWCCVRLHYTVRCGNTFVLMWHLYRSSWVSSPCISVVFYECSHNGDLALNWVSYRGDFSLMVLLPCRSDSGVRGLFLVTPDHEQTGWHRVKEHKTTHSLSHTHNRQKHSHTHKKIKSLKPFPSKNTPLNQCDTPVLLQWVLCALLLEI